ncbi:hypothetical protein TSUD_215590 [Trifolium subterraneum]|uniref:Uncharacterized protein n=1 Tax=Trifolium subterraneum TaxID=3900 RepID=A0A2Z6M8E4_TRISU|nr:hypothetical protein TSUD_215590 [Trifolium subterraneum]
MVRTTQIYNSTNSQGSSSTSTSGEGSLDEGVSRGPSSSSVNAGTVSMSVSSTMSSPVVSSWSETNPTIPMSSVASPSTHAGYRPSKPFPFGPGTTNPLYGPIPTPTDPKMLAHQMGRIADFFGTPQPPPVQPRIQYTVQQLIMPAMSATPQNQGQQFVAQEQPARGKLMWLMRNPNIKQRLINLLQCYWLIETKMLMSGNMGYFFRLLLPTFYEFYSDVKISHVNSVVDHGKNLKHTEDLSLCSLDWNSTIRPPSPEKPKSNSIDDLCGAGCRDSKRVKSDSGKNRFSFPASSTLMEAHDFAEMMEHVDEVNFVFHGLRKGQPVRIRKASLVSLLSICATT